MKINLPPVLSYSAASEFIHATLWPGAVLRVNWSNGAGFSLYEVQDDDGPGPHKLRLLAEYEICNDRTYRKMPT